MTASRRLFFACWPDPPTRAAMVAASRESVRRSDGRPVPADGLHVTLAFLGAVAEARLPEVLAVAAGVAAAPFELCFEDIEHWRKPQVLTAVAGAAPAAATQLAGRLGVALAAAGFALDSRPWRPHVTLARKVLRPCAGSRLAPPVRWPVRGLALVESLPRPGGMRYQVLGRWPLGGPGSPADPPPPADCPAG